MKSSVLKQTQLGLEQLKETVENGGDVRANLNTKRASDIELRRLEHQVQNHPNYKRKFNL